MFERIWILTEGMIGESGFLIAGADGQEHDVRMVLNSLMAFQQIGFQLDNMGMQSG